MKILNNNLYFCLFCILQNIFSEDSEIKLYNDYLFYFENFKEKATKVSNDFEINNIELIDSFKNLYELYKNNENIKPGRESIKLLESIILLKEKLKMSLTLEFKSNNLNFIESLYLNYTALKKLEEKIIEKKLSDNFKNWQYIKFFISNNLLLFITYIGIGIGITNYNIIKNKKNKKIIPESITEESNNDKTFKI